MPSNGRPRVWQTTTSPLPPLRFSTRAPLEIGCPTNSRRGAMFKHKSRRTACFPLLSSSTKAPCPIRVGPGTGLRRPCSPFRRWQEHAQALSLPPLALGGRPDTKLRSMATDTNRQHPAIFGSCVQVRTRLWNALLASRAGRSGRIPKGWNCRSLPQAGWRGTP